MFSHNPIVIILAAQKTKMFPINGKVQHYAWGGQAFIPALLGISNLENRPFAEYWMGIHHQAVAVVQLSDNAYTGLENLIRSEPRRYLGQRLVSQFNDLPYLLKVLDVKDMLSIQVHPGREEALLGFETENAAGIPHDAPNRNYKDKNHKPEIMLALGEFWLLHGFRNEQDLAGVLEKNEALQDLLPIFEHSGFRGLYQYVMDLPQESVDKMLQPLADRILPLYAGGKMNKSNPDFWAARAMITYPGKMDRGIFSIYFFNLVKLVEGQAIFQGAGVPHAYLEGQNIELMSNSDNVLRGGLTPKHIDVAELMKHIHFEAVTPEIMEGVTEGMETRYVCPVPDFSLSRIDLAAGAAYEFTANGPEILFVLEGKGIAGDTGERSLKKGDAFFACSDEPVRISSKEPLKLVKAWVP
jgi:mannose-6-phosphate isomerase